MASRNTQQIRQRQLFVEALETRRLLASDWQNPGQSRDVSHDLSISPIDALLGINRLNSSQPRSFPARPINSTEPYYDVDGSGEHNPLDVLLVINALNRRQATAAVELLSDTGAGPGANLDRHTHDLSVRGNVSMGTAGQLWGRFEGDAAWHDFSAFLAANQSFTIQQQDLLQALGMPSDGLVTLQFQPRGGVGNAEIGTEVDLPINFDTTAPQFDFENQPNFFGAIAMATATSIEIPLGERASSLTLIPSQIKLYDATFSELSVGEVELAPQGISLAGDGLSLLIDLPSQAANIRYRVAIAQGAFEDAAGNPVATFSAAANHLSALEQAPLAVAQRVDVSSLQRVVKDFTFTVTSPDLFILGGLNASQASQLELISPSGRSVRTWSTGSTGGKLELSADNWAYLTELGQYRFRVAVPAANEVSFKVYLTSQLANVPSSLQLQGTFAWSESRVYAISTTNENRLYVANELAPESPFRATLLNEYGQFVASELLESDVVFDVPQAGRYVVLIEALAENRPVSFDYSLYLSATTQQSLNFGQFYEQTLTVPGQQSTYTFAAKSAKSYTLEFDSPFGSVVLELPNRIEDLPGTYAVEDAGAGFVQLSFNRSDMSSVFSRFRLVESTTVVSPPANGTVHTEPLVPGVTQRSLQAELDSFEFTFNANANAMFAFRDGTVGDISLFQLIAPSGSELSPSEVSQGTRIFRTPYTGQYRLRAFGSVGTEIVFQWQELSSATPLVATGDVHGEFPNALFKVYKFVATEPRFFAYASASTGGLLWKLIDQRGFAGFTERDLNEALDVPLNVGETYSLIIEKQPVQPDDQFDFRRSSPVTSVRSAALGVSTLGDLLARGDRQLLELPLTAGQLIQLTSNLDPSVARVRWLNLTTNELDGPLEIDAGRADRIGNTRTHRVEIQNMSDGPIAYSVQFRSVNPPVTPPPTLTGFDAIHSGSVGTSPQTFTVDVTAGTLFVLDWLLADDPLVSIEVTDPLGNILPTVDHGTDALQVVEFDGTVSIKISNLEAEPRSFSFRMLSPQNAEAISVGVKKTVSVIPFGSAVFRIPLTGATEIFLDTFEQPENLTQLFRYVAASSLSDAMVEGPFFNAQFLKDEAFVWAANSSTQVYTSEFTAINVATIPLLTLDTVSNLQTEAGRYYLVPFQTSAAVIVAPSTHALLTDQAGQSLATEPEGDRYSLKQPGLYRAIVTGDGTTIQFEIHQQVVTQKTAALGQAVAGIITKRGDVHRYPFQLIAGSPILLSLPFGDGRIARWVAPDGEVTYPLLQEGWAILPVHTSGAYALEVSGSAAQVNYSVRLTDLSQLSATSTSFQTGTVADGLVSAKKFVGLPQQLLELDNVSLDAVQIAIVDRLGIPLTNVELLNNNLLQLPDDGVAYVMVLPAESVAPLTFAYHLELVTSTSQAASLGQTVAGSLSAKWEGKTYTFNLTEPTWVHVAVKSTAPVLLGLIQPDGSTLVSIQEIFTLLLAGSYSVQIFNYSRTVTSFDLTIDLLAQTPLVVLDQAVPITRIGRYRLDVATAGRYELQLRDGGNTLISAEELLVKNLRGESIAFAPRGAFSAPGSYWLYFNESSQSPAGNYALRVVPITTTTSVLATGVLGEYALNANGLQEHVVSIVVKPGMRLLIDELELGSGGSVEVRFADRFLAEWMPVEFLPPVLVGSNDAETLQFRFSGTGLARLHVQDLNLAPLLTLGTQVNVELGARRQGQAWLVNGNIGDLIEFVNDAEVAQSVLWMIIDESGNSLSRDYNQPLSFSIVNHQRFALVVRAVELLTAPLNVPFHTRAT